MNQIASFAAQIARCARTLRLHHATASALICGAVLASAAPALAEHTLPHPPAAAHPAGDLQHAVDALRAITTMRADFVQTDSNGGHTSGVISMKRGGKIRFQYAPGTPMLIIADGHALTMIDTEARQIQRWPIGNSPLGALLDPGRDVSRYGTLVPTETPGLIGIQVRDRAHPEYGVLTLVMMRNAGAPDGLELVGWITTDAQSRRTNIRLSNHRYGMPLDDALFRYTNPFAGPHH